MKDDQDKEIRRVEGQWSKLSYISNKEGCVFLMVISSEFRMVQYRNDDQEDAPHFFIIP